MNRRQFLTLMGLAGISVALPGIAHGVSTDREMPSSGWVNSGGRLIQWGATNNGIVNFPIHFPDTNYTVQAMSSKEAPEFVEKHGVSGFKTSSDIRVMWVAIGKSEVIQ